MEAPGGTSYRADMISVALLFLTQVVAEEAERVHTAWGAAVVEATRTASRRALQSDSEQLVLGGNGGWGNWASQDDRVMGGVSVSTMVASGDDAIFSGTLRLESNGGFTSVRTSFRKDVRAYDGLRVNFFPSSRRLLMYLQPRSARSVLCSRSLIALPCGYLSANSVPCEPIAGTSESTMPGWKHTAPRCMFHRSARPEGVPSRL